MQGQGKHGKLVGDMQRACQPLLQLHSTPHPWDRTCTRFAGSRSRRYMSKYDSEAVKPGTGTPAAMAWECEKAWEKCEKAWKQRDGVLKGTVTAKPGIAQEV